MNKGSVSVWTDDKSYIIFCFRRRMLCAQVVDGHLVYKAFSLAPWFPSTAYYKITVFNQFQASLFHKKMRKDERKI
jgi:hypothetical protein